MIKCKNPRCITSIEQGLDQIFVLADEEKEVYRCKYCDEKVYRKTQQINMMLSIKASSVLFQFYGTGDAF